MSEITGIVQEVVAKAVAGGKKAYDIIVAGQAYGAGLYAPKCKQGDYVKFELDDSRGYKNVARNSLKISSHKPPAEAVEMSQVALKVNGGGYDSRQDIISRQAATNTAIAFMTILSENDALGLPAANSKGKKAEVLEAMLTKYTQHFYEFNTGVAFKDITPKKAEAAEEEEEQVETPEDEQWH